jgi:hypothetical protein
MPSIVNTLTQRHDKNKIYSQCRPKALMKSVRIIIQCHNNIEAIHECNPVNLSEDQHCKLHCDGATMMNGGLKHQVLGIQDFSMHETRCTVHYSNIHNFCLNINLLKTKINLLCIRNQAVPRCKHFLPRL